MDSPAREPVDGVGVVVIGRNEAARLGCSLESVGSCAHVVYVDSRSTDGSADIARARGVPVIELDATAPLSAARARNEGFRRLRGARPPVRFVQFVDGDCELQPGWLEAGARFLEAHPDAGTVSGRLRERDPAASIYNAVCDIEWEVPEGESQACGGNFMARAEAFEQAGGFRGDLLAGEEPEFARRLHRRGWRNWRIADSMALHDADMRTFAQWWRRTVRNGYGFAQGFHSSERAAGPRLWARELRSTWLWGAAVPGLAALCAAAWGPWGLAILLAYPLQVLRITARGTRSPRVNFASALLLVAGKFAQLAGHLRFLGERRSRPSASTVTERQA